MYKVSASKGHLIPQSFFNDLDVIIGKFNVIHHINLRYNIIDDLNDDRQVMFDLIGLENLSGTDTEDHRYKTYALLKHLCYNHGIGFRTYVGSTVKKEMLRRWPKLEARVQSTRETYIIWSMYMKPTAQPRLKV